MFPYYDIFSPFTDEDMKRFAQIVIVAGKAVQEEVCEVTNNDTQPSDTPTVELF